ncbi:MAG: NYN domain-containing protein [Patescibacteria group bacterium]|nr:NYN domain-containing protein [Patescibacteria group bacterium]MDE2015186.1 NYN domain-containing protein [Patescibacteria group bacterium]MDE2226614.1 NYN domain-containing protein [Patescibacteria group bacterium]
MKSVPSYSNQRVGIFVDVHNLYHSAKNLYHGRVNYSELIKYLVGDRQLIRSMAYVVKSEGIIEQPVRPTAGTRRGAPVLSTEAAFFEALENAGLELRVKDLQVYAGGMKKADWDVGMAVDAIRMSSFLDVIILVTGDGDHLPLVDYLKWGVGRLVEVAAFKRSASAKLQDAADKFINIEEIPKIIIKRGY